PHRPLGDCRSPEPRKDMIERRGEVRRGVGESAVEIEGYDVEIDVAHAIAALGARYGNGKISVRWQRGRSGKLMTPTPFAAVILAAGMGTRMKSDLHKVLHPIAGRPMIEHLLASVEQLSPARVAIVVGSGREQLEPLVAAHGSTLVAQEPQLGTGHAVQQARQALDGFAGDVLILYGDTPLVAPETMARMLARLHAPDEPAIVVLASRPADPRTYGRVIAGADGTIAKMVEYKDGTDQERACSLCNSGLMAVRVADLFGLLGRVGNDNAAGEYYLPDIVMLTASDGRRSVVVETDEWEVAGVNSRSELAAIEGEWQRRRREQAMAEGVSLVAPETVWFAHDTTIGRDSQIEANVVFGPGVTIGERVKIRAFSHIEGARIGDGAEIGPYARLRPGAEIGEKAKIGNFVEIKKARFGRGAKANHLSYIGDAEVGDGANVGAGTITCNYDGFLKYPTKIGEGAFIGSNSALVAPVVIGKGAIVGAGSVVTRDVPDDALAVARGSQVEKPGWALRFREKMAARKQAK
ncbi:MAG: glmU, partial [Alphaproteobacteria bacterium]|nr:glmU [Alphaproteobacteria bacterium]